MENLRFDDWRSSLRSVCGDFEALPPPHKGLFVGEVSRQGLGALDVARIRTNARWIGRRRVNADRAEDRHCFLILQRTGRQQIRTGEATLELLPGDMALVDTARPFEISPCGLIENISVHLDRSAVLARLPGKRLSGKLSPGCTTTRLIRTLLTPVYESGHDAPAASLEGEALQEALIALMIPSLGEGASPPGLGDQTSDRDLLNLAIRLIDASLQEGALAPAELAARLNISVRRLYRLFEAQGESVSRYIQLSRLQRVAGDLLDPELKGESITRIAFRWGFTDAAHFSRAFKRRYELSPRDYRAAGLRT